MSIVICGEVFVGLKATTYKHVKNIKKVKKRNIIAGEITEDDPKIGAKKYSVNIS